MQDRAADYRWDDLRVLLALMREGTLAGAAARLGVDATTVGRRLTALEQALGTTLFDRTRDGVLPTAAAERLLPLAEETEQKAASLLASASAFERAPEGVVRLTAPPVLADLLVVPLLAEVAERYPGLSVELDASTSMADLSRREADLALRMRRPEGADLIITKLFDSPYCAYGAGALVERLGAVSDLSDARWIGWTAEFASIPPARWAKEHLAEDRCYVLRAASMATHLTAARQGLGVALLPEGVGALHGLSRLRARGDAKRALDALPTEAVWLVGHRALRGVPRVAVLWELLADRTPKMVRDALRRRAS